MTKLIFSLTILFMFSCGIKGPPLPPIDEETLEKQKQEQINAKSQIFETQKASQDQTTSGSSSHQKSKKK